MEVQFYTAWKKVYLQMSKVSYQLVQQMLTVNTMVLTFWKMWWLFFLRWGAQEIAFGSFTLWFK